METSERLDPLRVPETAAPPADPAEAPPPAETEDLHCPVCDYALRGLPEPRCPECGYAFEWEELRERVRRRQLWFYEHAGTFKSHLKTRWHSLRPWSFWSEIHAYSDADTGRLWVYRGVTLALLVLVAFALLALPVVQQIAVQNISSATLNGHLVTATTRPNVPYSVSRIVIPSMTFPRYRNGQATTPAPVPSRVIYQYYIPPPWWVRVGQPLLYARPTQLNFQRIGWAAALTIGVIVGLPIYWQLLRVSVLRANIRPVHLARVDAYSADVLPWMVIIYAAAEMTWLVVHPYDYSGSDISFIVAHLLIGPVIIVGALTLRMASALRRYVRFPQAAAVASCYGLMATLAWLIVLLRTTRFY